MFKNISIFILSIFFLIFALLFFDMASYDSSYINRNALVFDVKNVNSPEVFYSKVSLQY